MPEVLQSAINTIRGTVKVRVKVNVDQSGTVEDAELESRGPSKYFARAALEAAQMDALEAQGFRPQYIAVRTPELALPQAPDRHFIVLGAAWMGATRLIDNLAVAEG